MLFRPFDPLIGQALALSKINDHRILEKAKHGAESLIVALKQTNKDLNRYLDTEEGSPRSVAVQAAKEKISKLTGTLSVIFGDQVDEEFKDNWLTFLDTRYDKRLKQSFVVLHLKPIEIAPLMRSLILSSDRIKSVVFISATMRVKKSFNFMKRELGLFEPLTFVGESPFNYRENVVGYFPKHLPEPGAPGYEAELAAEITDLILRTKGKALVLFTSNTLLSSCTALVRNTIPYEILVQGDASKNALIEAFKSDTHSCLFATKSFFTGVDIPGEALSNVILTKAPFRVPSEPMFNARCQKLEEAGKRSFDYLSMPLMLFDVQQAFGRLIRTTSDSGMFSLLDSRANKKSYGDDIKKALPKIRMTDKLGK